jgi:sulfur relay (sulfurtransferase) complex TusBCD TusD component (DsrE family)
MEKMLGAMLNKGVEVKACGTCINARGLDVSELVEGVERGSMKILVEWIRDSDKVISF